MGFFASVNGEITPAEQARVSVLDNGFTFGDAVYETLRTYGGRPLYLDRPPRRPREAADRPRVAPAPVGACASPPIAWGSPCPSRTASSPGGSTRSSSAPATGNRTSG